MSYISVIIATHNRCESLKKTLESLSNQEVNDSFDYEIIIVDNNSKDKTEEIVKFYLDRFNNKLKYITEPKQGKSYALNMGLKVATGEIMAFCDDDVIVDPKWLLSIIKCFEGYYCDGMGGRVLPVITQDMPAWVKKNEELLVGPIVRHDYGEEIKPYDKTGMRAFIGCNMAIKASCFPKIGQFRTDLGPGQGYAGEDTDIYNRLTQVGAKLYYNGASLVLHPISKERFSYGYLIKHYFRLGKFYTKMDYEKVSRNNPTCYFGVPRYLAKAAFTNLIKMVRFMGNPAKGLPHLIKMSVAVGEGLEYRQINKKITIKGRSESL